MMQTSGKEQNTNYVSNANEKKKKKRQSIMIKNMLLILVTFGIGSSERL